MRVLVLGVGGMLGHKLFEVLSGDLDVWGTVRQPLEGITGSGISDTRRTLPGVDAFDFSSVVAAIDRIRPAVIINGIGIVKQLREASDEGLLMAINADLPHRLADIAASTGARLVHISTDCVFSGRRGNYDESDVPDPVDAYGGSKLKGELVDGPGLTLRTSFVGRELASSHGLIEWFFSKRGSRVTGFANAFFSGLTTNELARVIRTVIRDHPHLSGVYHVSGPRISKYELLCLLNERTRVGCQIVASEEPFIDRSLDSTRFRSAVNWVPPTWEQMLDEVASERG